MMRLKAIEGEYCYWNLKKLQRCDVNIWYFAPLQFSKQEWSVAPSIINIIEQGLAHYVL